jgi:hypothetical protein
MPDVAITLQLVQTTNDIRSSLRSFIAGPADKTSGKRLARSTSYWVYEPKSGGFGPGKFVGYVGMSLDGYERAKVGKFEGARFDGHTTRQRIEGIVGRDFEPNTRLAHELHAWGAARFGANVFVGVDTTKWRFLSLSADERPAPRTPVSIEGAQSRSTRPRAVGAPYRPANEDLAVAALDPFEVDPELIERGTRGHARTQNALAGFLQSSQMTPLSPVLGDPEFDVAWRSGDTLYVAEVKSITDLNEEKQLRLGLGQVLWYRHRLADECAHVVGVLVAEREPTDSEWENACSEVGIILVWPPEFTGLL